MIDVIDTLIRYGPGGQHPVVRPKGSRWVIVDALGPNWKHIEDGYDPGRPIAHFIHFDGDDPLHEFLDLEAWAPLPNARNMAKAYNLPFTRSIRLRGARARSGDSSLNDMWEAHYLARQALDLAASIRADAEEAHTTPGDSHLEYYPHDGSVWKRGQRWLRTR